MIRSIRSPGGEVQIGTFGRFDEPRMVRLDVREQVELSPDEARRVAVGLIEVAADVERRNRRREGRT